MTRGALVITGAGRGIGAATAKMAAAAGYAVCVNYKERNAPAEAVVAAIKAAGGKAIAVQADVSDASSVAALFAAADRELGPLVGLVNNAGVAGPRTPFGDIDPAVFKDVMDVNVLGSFLCAQAAVARMSTARGGSGGAIVNLSSVAARTGGFRLAHYVSAKGAIVSMTKALALELAEVGIRVNAVAPGVIATDQNDLSDPERVAKLKASVPLGRAGTPDEVARAIVYLLSDAASYITGTVLEVAGGR